MILKKWLAYRTFDPTEPLCEIEVDGKTRVIPASHSRFGADDVGYMYHAFTAAGEEIGPDGFLCEFTEMTRTRKGLQQKEAIPLHAIARLKRTRRKQYPGIFVNFRRNDADAYAGRFHELLSSIFGEDEVFLAEFSIKPGEIWDWTIQHAVAHARVMLVLVGPRWLQKEEDGKRRIDSLEDVVRREIVGMLDAGKAVTPVLLPDAVIPVDFQWNDPLRLLSSHQFHRLGGVRHWKTDVDALVATVKEQMGAV